MFIIFTSLSLPVTVWCVNVWKHHLLLMIKCSFRCTYNQLNSSNICHFLAEKNWLQVGIKPMSLPCWASALNILITKATDSQRAPTRTHTEMFQMPHLRASTGTKCKMQMETPFVVNEKCSCRCEYNHLNSSNICIFLAELLLMFVLASILLLYCGWWNIWFRCWNTSSTCIHDYVVLLINNFTTVALTAFISGNHMSQVSCLSFVILF